MSLPTNLRPATLAEALAVIERLLAIIVEEQARIAELEGQVTAVQAQVTALTERLGQTSSPPGPERLPPFLASRWEERQLHNGLGIDDRRRGNTLIPVTVASPYKVGPEISMSPAARVHQPSIRARGA